jgi:hypothetical protein
MKNAYSISFSTCRGEFDINSITHSQGFDLDTLVNFAFLEVVKDRVLHMEEAYSQEDIKKYWEPNTQQFLQLPLVSVVFGDSNEFPTDEEEICMVIGDNNVLYDRIKEFLAGEEFSYAKEIPEELYTDLEAFHQALESEFLRVWKIRHEQLKESNKTKFTHKNSNQNK